MTDQELNALYADVRRAFADVIPDFDFAVEDVYRYGEPEAAVVYGLVGAAAEDVPIPADILERAWPLLDDHERSLFPGSGRPAA